MLLASTKGRLTHERNAAGRRRESSHARSGGHGGAWPGEGSASVRLPGAKRRRGSRATPAAAATATGSERRGETAGCCELARAVRRAEQRGVLAAAAGGDVVNTITMEGKARRVGRGGGLAGAGLGSVALC